MKSISSFLIGTAALLHLGFFTLETFLWSTPLVQNRLAPLGLSPEELAMKLAANQGLYNSFLAVGLMWVLLAKPDKVSAQIFFLTCALIAGIYGGLTIKDSILWFQAAPAAIALLSVFGAQRQTHAKAPAELH